MNMKSEKLFLKLAFDSTETFVELRFFPKIVMSFGLLWLKTKWQVGQFFPKEITLGKKPYKTIVFIDDHSRRTNSF